MTAAALSQEPKYENKVFVVNNGRVSTPLHRSILDAIDLVEDGYTAQQIKDILEASREKTVIYVGLSTLEYLKKGGRINTTTALAASLLNIKCFPEMQRHEKIKKSHDRCYAQRIGNNFQKRI